MSQTTRLPTREQAEAAVRLHAEGSDAHWFAAAYLALLDEHAKLESVIRSVLDDADIEIDQQYAVRRLREAVPQKG